MQEKDTKPWYKQFWPWFLIVIPASSMVVGSFVIRFAYDGTNSLVVDDYYKEGRAINARLDKIELAKKMSIVTSLSVQQGSIELVFISGAPTTGEALKLDFYHVTIEDRDFEVLLTRDANGIYRSNQSYPIDGTWRIRLTPMNEEWKVQDRINLPHAGAFRFEP